MKRINYIVIIIFLISISLTGCHKNGIKNIKADDFTISYGHSYYETKDKVDKKTIKRLVKQYNSLKFNGETNEEINYDKGITIIFIYKDKISGHITMDDKGICEYGDDSKHYWMYQKSSLYKDAITVYNDVKKKYEE